MTKVTLQFTSYKVAANNTPCPTVNDNYVDKFVTCVKGYFFELDLPHQCLICTQQKLLTSLSLCIEGTAYLSTTERTVIKQTTIFTCERYTLRNALVYY